MKALYSFTRKNLKMNRHRTVVTIVGVVLTCILLFGLGFGVTINMNREMDETIQNIGSYHFAYEDVSSSLIDEISHTGMIEKMEIESLIQEYQVSFYRVQMYARDAYSLSNLTLLEGTYPTEETEILLDTVLLQFYHKELGDTVTIEGEDYQIVGVYEADHWVVGHQVYTYRKQMTGDVSLYMTLRNTKDAYSNIHDLSNSLGFSVITYLDGVHYEHEKTNDHLLQRYGEYRDYGKLALQFLILMFFLTILSIVCILIIYNAFAISVTERKKMLGMLASIGATPGQLLKSVLYEATFIALCAIPLGFLITYGASYLIVMILNHVYADILTVPLSMAIHPVFFLTCLIFILISIYLSALFPAMRAREVTPLDAIFSRQDIKLRSKNVKSSTIIRKLFGIEGEIAYKNRKRNKKKYRIVTLSLIIGIVLFMTFSAFLDLQKSVLQTNQENDPFSQSISLTLSGDPLLKEAYFEKLMDGITTTKLEKSQSTFVTLEDSMQNYFTEEVSHYDSNYHHLRLIALSDEEYSKILKENGFSEKLPLLDNTFVRYVGDIKQMVSLFDEVKHLSFQIGQSSSEEGTPLTIDSFYVGEVENNSLYPSLYVSESVYQEWIEQAMDENFKREALRTAYLIETDDFKIIEERYQQLKVPYSSLEVWYTNNPYDVYLNRLQLQLWNVLVFGIILFIALIAITSVINTIHTSMNLRRKEFAVLRSVGMTQNGFYKMIRLESFFFGVQSLVIGLLISTGLIYLLHELLNFNLEEQEKIVYPYPFTYLCITIVGVFLIILFTSIYSTRKFRKDNIADVLKEDDF